MEYRAKSGTLLMVGEVQYGQPWFHQADLPVRDMMGPRYFAAWRNELKPGDTIRLVRVRAERVMEMAEIMVVQVHPDRIEHSQLGPVKRFPAPDMPEAEPEIPPEKYVDSDKYTVEPSGAGWFRLKDPDGNIVHKTRDRDEAYAMRAGSIPLAAA